MLLFVSHSSADRLFVEEKLLPFLHKHEISTWCSTADIKTTDDWEAGIRSGLKASDYFLVVISNNALASTWVRAEVLWAMKNRMSKVVPVLLDSCVPKDLHLQLALIQHVDLREDTREQWRTLADYWPSEKTTFKRGSASFTFLGRIDDGHQVFLSRKRFKLVTWDGQDLHPIDMFKTPLENPVMSSLSEEDQQPDKMEELFSIPDGADWCVRLYRLDFPDEKHCWFDFATLGAINIGQFYVVPVEQAGISIFGAEGMKKPLMTAILSCANLKGGLSVLVAILPGSV